jgi:hypothetical protein
METIRYLTKVSGFLQIDSHERSRYQDFDPAYFFAPGPGWIPPYPYCPQDVLFPVTYRETDAQTVDVKRPLLFEELLEGASFREQSFAIDDLGSS